MTVEVAIVGGSGYIGGELLRLLTFHPEATVVQVTSQRHAGQAVHHLHPNLHGFTNLRFSRREDLGKSDVLFLALPHGESAANIEGFAHAATYVVDCSADFRLKSGEAYARWYGGTHPSPSWLGRFVYGLPERHREALRSARYASGVGCNATVLNLALAPLAEAGWLEHVVAEVKVGSSEAGAAVRAASHHPIRSGSVRVYSPLEHRHLAEVRQELGVFPLHLTVTAIEMVRGVHLTAQCFLGDAPRDVRAIWSLYRKTYGEEPFIRLMVNRRGLYRYPEPKILAGSNYCDIGFAYDEGQERLVLIAALDNLVKGGAGTAVQAMNLMLGLDERMGLAFPGLHPV